MHHMLAFAMVLTFLATLFPATPLAANDDDLNEQRKSMLGAGVRFSSDKPSFRGRAEATRKSEKVDKEMKKDPLDGGVITGQINQLLSGGGQTRYRYKYSQYYPERPMFKDADIILCEKCKARAVLDACAACEGRSFIDLCDKCKARAILNACESCQARIRASKDAAEAPAEQPAETGKSGRKKQKKN